MPRFDVIIPAYNTAKYLPAAIESVAAQTFADWRILLVDDGSTDDTVEVVAPFLDRLGSRISYIKQDNRGLPAARNTAIRASTSEFLALLDADDVWTPCRLSESLKVLEERPQAGLAYGQVTLIDPEGRTLRTFEGNPRHGEGRIATHIYTREINLPCPTMTFRRRCIDEVGYFDETMRATEDRDLWLRIALRHEVAFVPQVLAFYRVSPNSMSADLQRMLQSQLQFIRKHYGEKGCGFFPRQISLARAYRQLAEGLAAQGRSWAAVVNSLRAMALYPFALENARTVASALVNSTLGRRDRS
jgi:glycosyltransferase involved in cell wall biosynthesis